MKRTALLAVVAVSLSVFAAGKPGSKQVGDVKADSMVYDKPTQWQLYSVAEPVHAFALQAGTLWVATESVVASINRAGKRAEIQKFQKLGAMPAENIAAIAGDKQGRVWFGGPAGLAMKSGSQFTIFTKANGLTDDKVTALAASSDGSIWAGTDNGANLYAGGTWKQFTVKEGLVSDKIQTILADANGAVWFGTDKGISVYDGVKWTSHTMKNGMSWNNTRALAYDRRKGTVWAAVGEKDVNCFDGEKWIVFMDIQKDITSIMADSQSRIWFGSDNGIIKFNGDDWINDAKQLGVSAAKAFQLNCDERGNLWFATERGVIFMANPYPF